MIRRTRLRQPNHSSTSSVLARSGSARAARILTGGRSRNPANCWRSSSRTTPSPSAARSSPKRCGRATDWDASLRHTLSNAATTLRTTLRTAAVAAPDELQPLVAARRQLQLPPALFALDVDAFDAALRHAAGLPDPEALDEYERALGLYAGEFLEGERFTWLDSHRIKHRQRLWDAARTAAAIAERMGDPARAVPLHRTVLKQEPTDEDAARGLMRCLARSGDVAGVRQTFTALSEAWVRELDDDTARPSPPTRALFTELVGATAHG